MINGLNYLCEHSSEQYINRHAIDYHPCSSSCKPKQGPVKTNQQSLLKSEKLFVHTASLYSRPYSAVCVALVAVMCTKD